MIKSALGLVICAIIMFVLIGYSAPKKGTVVRVDCTWSEISPDFTTEIRELCRKARMDQIRK